MKKGKQPIDTELNQYFEDGITLIDEQLYRYIFQVKFRQIPDIKKLFKMFDLTVLEHSVIHNIYLSKNNNMKISELGEYLFTQTPNITRTILGLEKKELVSRKSDDQDRRITWVSLTKKAVTILDALHEPCAELHQAHFSALSKTEKKQLLKLLFKLHSKEEKQQGSNPGFANPA